MTAKEHWDSLRIERVFDPEFVIVNVANIQSILDDARRQGMLEAAEFATSANAPDWITYAIKKHAAKLFPKEPV